MKKAALTNVIGSVYFVIHPAGYSSNLSTYFLNGLLTTAFYPFHCEPHCNKQTQATVDV